MTEKQFSDEELSAYLDGELEPHVAAEIKKKLSTEADLARRLEALRFPVDALQFGAEQMLKGAPDYDEPILDEDRLRFARLFPYAAILLIGLSMGYIGSLLQPAQKSGDWITAVASYQALYIEETLANAEQSSKMTDEVLNSFGNSQAVPVVQFKELPTLVFKRAQLLGFKGEPLLQMAFTTASGQPVALCITPVNEADRVPEFGNRESLPAADWIKDGKGYILIGNMDPDDMRSAVSKIRQQLG
jgi:anti-sigma factor RsiW